MRISGSTEKSYRVLDFLTALEHPSVAASLENSGFNKSILDDGWRLLREYAGSRITTEEVIPLVDYLKDASAWESRWVPVIRASLRARHPGVLDRLLTERVRGSDRRVVLVLALLLEQIRALDGAKPRSDEAAARALLIRRGLTEAVVAEGEQAVARAHGRHDASNAAPAAEPRLRQAAKDAEAALWDWYLEWSEISRATIADPQILKVLGFGKPGRPKGSRAKRKAKAAAKG